MNIDLFYRSYRIDIVYESRVATKPLKMKDFFWFLWSGML